MLSLHSIHTLKVGKNNSDCWKGFPSKGQHLVLLVILSINTQYWVRYFNADMCRGVYDGGEGVWRTSTTDCPISFLIFLLFEWFLLCFSYQVTFDWPFQPTDPFNRLEKLGKVASYHLFSPNIAPSTAFTAAADHAPPYAHPTPPALFWYPLHCFHFLVSIMQ